MSNSKFFFGFPFEDFFDDLSFKRAWHDLDRVLDAYSGTNQTFPPYNIYALKNGSARVEVALAGYTVDDLEISVEDSKLRLKNKDKSTESNKDEESKKVYQGIRSSNFSVTFPFEPRFELSKATAAMKNGMLIIDVPLSEERKAKEIKINTI